MACSPDRDVFEEVLPPPDLELTGEDDDPYSVLRQWDKMQKVAGGNGDLKVGFSDEIGKDYVLSMGIKDNFLVLNNMGSGRVAYVSFVRVAGAPGQNGQSTGLFPELVFSDGLGNTLKDENGNLLNFLFSSLGSLTASDWLMAGVKLFAVGLAAWLGFKIAGLVIAILAWLAFNLLVLGILIVGFEALKWLLNLTGWNMQVVYDFFLTIKERIVEMGGF